MAVRAPGATTLAGYGRQHQIVRQLWAPQVATGKVQCARCGELIGPLEKWDLGHVDGDRTRYAGPEHERCNRATAGRRRFLVELEPERPGLDAGDRRWRVPWLDELCDPPADATWPRLMTVPHPRAAGSLWKEFAKDAEERSGHPLRWWQQLVAARVLEVDAAGDLVWETVLLTMARQLGKSWLLREMLLWRILQGDRFGGPQTVIHTGKDVAVVKEVQRDARLWAKRQPGVFKVSEVNGQESIERLEDGSRWLLKAKGAVEGYSASMAAVDEAWKVNPEIVDAGLEPTLVAPAQSQLWLVSTAHRMATPLMLRARNAALADLEDGENGSLLVEWSAPEMCDLDDVEAWRLASPHWTEKRQRLMSRRLVAAQAGESFDKDEPDALEAFRAQWLNQWPRMPTGAGEALLPEGLWAELAGAVDTKPPLWVALEDEFGVGAAVGAASVVDDGRIEVAAWRFDEWDDGVAKVLELAAWFHFAQFVVGKSLLDRVPAGQVRRPTPATSAQTKVGLAVFRDLAMTGRLVHDTAVSDDLGAAIEKAKIRETMDGLAFVTPTGMHVVKAAAWAVAAAHAPSKIPAIR